MKTITIRELHARTGQWVRSANQHGEVLVTDRGETIAKIVPHKTRDKKPYFARRTLLPEFEKLEKAGKFQGGLDATDGISADRDDRTN